MLFATILIALQTDVYTDSQFDRSHQSYSVYADILTIAEALKSIPEYNLPELLGSPREIDEKIGNRKHGMRFDTRGLPPGRSDEKWAAMEEKLRECELASGDQGATEEFELHRMDAMRLDWTWNSRQMGSCHRFYINMTWTTLTSLGLCLGRFRSASSGWSKGGLGL